MQPILKIHGGNIALARHMRGMTRKRLSRLLYADDSTGRYSPVYIRDLERKTFWISTDSARLTTGLALALHFPLAFFSTERDWKTLAHSLTQAQRTGASWEELLCEFCWQVIYERDKLRLCDGPVDVETVHVAPAGSGKRTKTTKSKATCDAHVCTACAISFQRKDYCPRCYVKGIGVMTTWLKAQSRRDPDKLRAVFQSLSLWIALQEAEKS